MPDVIFAVVAGISGVGVPDDVVVDANLLNIFINLMNFNETSIYIPDFVVVVVVVDVGGIVTLVVEEYIAGFFDAGELVAEAVGVLVAVVVAVFVAGFFDAHVYGFNGCGSVVLL